MVRASWVCRERCGSDERVVVASLTDEGRALQEKASDVPLRVGTCIPLSEERGRELYELMAACDEPRATGS